MAKVWNCIRETEEKASSIIGSLVGRMDAILGAANRELPFDIHLLDNEDYCMFKKLTPHLVTLFAPGLVSLMNQALRDMYQVLVPGYEYKIW